MVLAIVFGVCQVIAACCCRKSLGVMTVNFGQILEVLLAMFAYATIFYQLVKYLLSRIDLKRKKEKEELSKFVFDRHPFVAILFLFVSPVANNKRYFLPIVYCAPLLFTYFMYCFEKLKKG